MSAPPGVWIHRDERGLQETVELGMVRALSGDWESGLIAERVRALRGWLLEHAWAQARLTGQVTETKSADGGIAITIDPSIRAGAPAERDRATRILYQTCAVMADASGRELALETSVPKPTPETAGWPLVAAAAVITIGQVAAIGYMAHQAAQVIDRKLSRDHDMRMLVQRDAQVLKLVRAHTEREDKAKKALPLDEATKLALNGLLKQQQAIVEKKLAPLASGLPDVPSGAAGFGLGLLFAAAAAAYLLITH